MMDRLRADGGASLRRTDDIERLLGAPWYRVSRAVVRAADPLDRRARLLADRLRRLGPSARRTGRRARRGIRRAGRPVVRAGRRLIGPRAPRP